MVSDSSVCVASSDLHIDIATGTGMTHFLLKSGLSTNMLLGRPPNTAGIETVYLCQLQMKRKRSNASSVYDKVTIGTLLVLCLHSEPH